MIGAESDDSAHELGHRGRARACVLCAAVVVGALFRLPVIAQDHGPTAPAPTGQTAEDQPPPRVDVQSQVADRAISTRLERILNATEWFEAPQAETREGVVFLRGLAESEARKSWASELARSTEDVVAVVNEMRVRRAPLWDFGPAVDRLRALARGLVLALPAIGFALFVLLATYLLARLTRWGVQRVSRRHIQSALLRRVVARTGSTLVMLLGIYVILHVSGLTRLAVSVLGGTGVVGLVLGIAFRDISENFLASIFLSVQRPFRVDDLVELAGITGYIQRTTYRVTVLTTLEGQQVQIPNSTVYKSVIRNFTSHPARREDFAIGIGFDVAISRAQEVAREVLAAHPAVLREPEPWVLVDSLGAATVNLRIYFWLDGTQHSWLKVRSSVIRLVKRAFQEAGVSMPDEAREVVFPRGVPLRMLESDTALRQAERDVAPPCTDESAATASAGESDLETDADLLKEQGKHARPSDGGAENLLAPPPDGRS